MKYDRIIARIFGYILGDGWIDIKGGCGASGDRNSLKILAQDINYLWGSKSTGNIRTTKTFSPKYNIKGTTSQFTIHTNVRRDLEKLGMPRGKRVLQEYTLPKWISSGTNEIKKNFFSGFYAAEGLIPSLQCNKKTPRPLSFCFSKIATLENNATEISKDFINILNSLGLNVSISKLYEVTNAKMVKHTFTINNSEQDFIKAISLMDLRYCLNKEIRRQQLLTYFRLKEQRRQEALILRDQVVNYRLKHNATYRQLSKIFKITKAQAENYFNGKQKCKVLKNFPKFDYDFINTYCPIKTPLNDETLFKTDNDVPSLINSKIK